MTPRGYLPAGGLYPLGVLREGYPSKPPLPLLWLNSQGDCKVIEGSAGGKPAGVLGVSPKLNLLLARAIAKYLLRGKRYFAIALAE